MSDAQDMKPGPVMYVPPPAPPAEAFGQWLMTALADPAIPADKLTAVMAMRREVLNDQAREAYQIAFAAFSAEMPPVTRDGMVELGQGRGRYPFTTYENMDRVLRPLLNKHGLALQFWSSEPESKDAVIVHGALIGYGWQREATYSVPPDTGPGRNALQARGSAQTYAKRYIADLLCNIVRIGKDDDGRMGAGSALIDAAQVAELDSLIKATLSNEAAFLKAMVTDAEKIEDVRVRDYARLVMVLNEKLKKKGKAK